MSTTEPKTVTLEPTPEQWMAAEKRITSLGFTWAQVAALAHDQWEAPYEAVQLRADFLGAIQATVRQVNALASGPLREDRKGQKQLFRGALELLRQAPKVIEVLKNEASAGGGVVIDVSAEEEPLPWRRPPLYCPECKALVDGRE